MKINGRSRPARRGRNARVVCSVCGRIVGAHSWGHGGRHRLAALHNSAPSVRCTGSLAEGSSP
jgi:hypothetical protein